ncbi:hypothetical protein CesoFtcFv8_001958 [Champsocephalus esox]|uniref:Uncharacterized protein n=1 Tax=Champsocephalus esox TaxID=159716 RepID=A0AAN8D385_9TELE|nr:hypothetical protein CesoFtcFv8_001958 [Champsocephalus esox]
MLMQTDELVSTREGEGEGALLLIWGHGGQTERVGEKEWKRGGGRYGQKTKGRCHVGPESLIDVMCSAALSQRFR